MKALKILKCTMKEDEKLAEEYGVSLTREYYKLMNDAIVELEQLQNKTCKTCKWYEESDVGISCEKWWDCSIAKPNRWESK